MSRLKCFGFSSFLLTWATLVPVHADRPAPSPDFPAMLVVTDLSTFEESESLSAWADAGVAGVVFTLKPNDWRESDALRQRLEQGREQAISAGFNHIFLRFGFSPEQNPAVESESEQMISLFAAVARVCRHAQLTGILLDVDSMAPAFDYLWDGYDWDIYPPVRMATEVRRFSRRLAISMYAAFPETQLLVLLPRNADACPLWFRWLEGFLEGVPETSQNNLHLVVRQEASTPREDPLATVLRRVTVRLSDDTGRIANTLGKAAYWDKGDAEASSLLSSFLHSTRYILLSQSLLTDPITYPKLWRIHNTLKAFSRVGFSSVEESGDRYFAMRGEKGAGILVWDEAFAQRLTGSLPGISVIDVTRGNEREPLGSLTTPETKHPLLVYPLPVKDWLAPACLWCEMSPSGTDSQMSLRYGMTNRTGFSLLGTLSAMVRGKGEVFPTNVPVRLATDEEITVDGRLAGTPVPPCQLTLAMTFASPDMKPLHRTFLIDVPPILEWRARLEGRVVGMNLCPQKNYGEDCWIALTDTGEMAAISMQGDLRWRKWFRCRFSASPVIGRGAFGDAQIMAISSRGEVLTCAPDGELLWRERVLLSASGVTPVLARLNVFPGDEIVVAGEDGSIVALLSNGAELWRYEGETRPYCIQAVRRWRSDYDAILVASGDTQFQLLGLSRYGKEMFRTMLDFAPSHLYAECGNLENSEPMVFLGGRGGEIELRHAMFGFPLARFQVSGPVRAFKPVFLSTESTAVGWYAGSRFYLWQRDQNLQEWDMHFDISDGTNCPGNEATVITKSDRGDFAQLFENGVFKFWKDARLDGLRTAGIGCCVSGVDKGIRFFLPVESDVWAFR